MIKRRPLDERLTHLPCAHCGRRGALNHGLRYRSWAGETFPVHDRCWPDFVAAGGPETEEKEAT